MLSFLRFLVFCSLLTVALADARQLELGSVDFSTSGSGQAQTHFLRGVAALHSFWYPVALEEFRAATRVDPDFMMGYWGEAMAHDHPIWGDPQDTEAARKAIAKIKITPQLTKKEKAHLHAVKILYGKGEKEARDQAYAETMEKIYREYPDDREAAAFYALALLGSVEPQDSAALQTRMKAGAIAMEVYREKPNHPGAAHYILHAFDDPNHAILALPAAKRYAKIAPDAPHALHMPSHIFLQLGMWEEAAKSNEASWAASKKWVERNNVSIAKRDYHSLHWLLYVYLQQGRCDDAEGLLEVMRKSLAEGPKDDPIFQGYGTFIYASMASAYIIESERWELANKLFTPLQKNPQLQSAAERPGPFQALAQYVQALAIFAPGFAAAKQGSADSQESIAELRAMGKQAGKEVAPTLGISLSNLVEIQRLEIAAAASAAKGDFEQAIEQVKQASVLEASSPPPGPPPLIKPSHEHAGEILLQAKRPNDAAREFSTSRLRHEDRAHSLIGTARAAARSGDRDSALAAYSEFVRQWKGDKSQPDPREARDFLACAEKGLK
ncbi:MAG: hypothetical protein ACREVK_02685 [Gammaproteobacteria bacterium]